MNRGSPEELEVLKKRFSLYIKIGTFKHELNSINLIDKKEFSFCAGHLGSLQKIFERLGLLATY
jgi:hypothetical protein